MKLKIIILIFFFKSTAVCQNTFNEVIAIELCDKIKKCLTSNLDKKNNFEICINQFEKEFKELEKLPPNVQDQFMNFFATNCLEELKTFVVKDDEKDLKKENTYSLNKENCEKFIHLEPTITNVLYEKIDNELEFATINLSSDSLSIKSTQGKIVKNDGLFLINGLTLGQVVVDIGVVDIGIKANYKKIFKVKELPIPKFTFKEFDNYSLTKKDLEKVNEIFGFLKDFDFPVLIKIKSFEIVLISKNEIKSSSINYGNNISTQCLEEIKHLDQGDLIIIKDINYSYFQKNFSDSSLIKNGIPQNVIYFIEE